MEKMWRWLTQAPTQGPAATLLVRLTVGGIFFAEGVLKFVYTNQGVGRFTKLGIPFPEFTANFIGVFEIVGGLMLMAGLLTRLVSIPFVIEMIVAILTTKVALYLGTSPLPLPPAPPQVGFWAVIHETRVDYSQIMLCLYLIFAGPGPRSIDALLRRKARIDW